MRIVQALHWLRDLLVREGESEQVKRKLAKLFEDPTAGPPLKADLIAGMTALPTWMWVFLKPLVESDADARRRGGQVVGLGVPGRADLRRLGHSGGEAAFRAWISGR